MKQGWEVKKLGEVFDLQMGKTPSRDTNTYWNGKNTWVSISDLNDKKYISQSKERITDVAIKETGIKLVPSRTVIMSFKLSIGKTAITLNPLFTNEAIMAFIEKEKGVIIPEFIYYYLKGYSWVGANKAVLGMTLNKKTISEQMFSYPPMAEQERIVKELDCLSGIIEKKKQQLKELDALAQSVFYEMFGDPVENEKGWEVKALGEVCEIVTGSTPSTTDESNWEGDVDWVTPAELGEQLYYGNTIRKITEKAAKSLTLMPIGTVLLSSRAPIGKIAITKVPMCCNQGFKNIICGNRLNNVFLYYYLMVTLDEIQALGRGATFKEVSKQAISNYQIYLPPLALQQQFASKIELIEKQKELIKQSIKETETLFNSRMDFYFSE